MSEEIELAVVHQGSPRDLRELQEVLAAVGIEAHVVPPPHAKPGGG